MMLATLPGIGHAPTLTEPEILAALRDVLTGWIAIQVGRRER